ncbi:tRNA lysidine(34) synthetase TilS [Candidatus Saccharibacteria bacterium]|nr:tRNA lysidine(34) synthetase TilS [Candidatus Saccharibacteria bacterium]
MRKILAVSGGIDSVVMLHYFRNDPDVIVAHFNHGIRSNSSDDQSFVQKLANQYGLKFVTEDAHLGAKTSEAMARKVRYDYLFSLCAKYNGKLYVAHHRDDVYESIAINILRGTGWRGLAPLRNPQIERPLLDWEKRDIYIYATKHHLSFRQDQTNTEDGYLRNRVRAALIGSTRAQKDELYRLYLDQCQIANEIEKLVAAQCVSEDKSIKRDVFAEVDDEIAQELLRELLLERKVTQTRPQLRRALAAIREYQPGKRFPLGKDHYIQISKYSFSIKNTNA